MRLLLFLSWKVLNQLKPKMSRYSLMTHEGSLSEVTADETSSIPVLEGFEPIETEGEQLQSDDQNSESLPEVTADETSSIPVLEGFEPIETEGEHYSLMTKIRSLSEVTADETSSIPVLEGFEPIETEDEQLQSDEK